MNIDDIAGRAKGIILEPGKEWPRIKKEQKSNMDLLLHYALPMIVLAALTSFIGSWSLHLVVYQLAMPLVSLVVSSYVINMLAGKFESTENLNNAFKLVVYAATPSLLASIVANLSFLLGWVGLFGLYSIYLFWIGIPVMMDTPESRRLGYVLLSALVIMVVQMVIMAVMAPSWGWGLLAG
ncbi:Yip1 family protein [Fodinibius sediminis]|uniref:Yip1 domain-containing protein n=1 Tax=Fodinibius sediminis TaxID=1214077 RepID=A0A521ARS3_9BACT|nr:Yip1 family protein [Fodinibius sediminis]SMO37528.1 Yip1 domain-containing protein [Fodinibius sediminis]